MKKYKYLIGIVVFTTIFLSMFSTRPYSDQDVYHLIGQAFRFNPTQTILFFLLIMVGIIIWEKIIINAGTWFKKHNLITLMNAKYELLYKNGKYERLLEYGNSKSLLKHFNTHQYTINKIKANIYLILDQEKLCYSSIKDAAKYADSVEKVNELDKTKFQLYIKSGSIKAAKDILSTIKINSTYTSLSTLSFYDAIFLEKEGKLEDARSQLLSAAQILEKENSRELFSVYNNLGRISGLLDNYSEKELYFRKAKSLIESNTIKYQHHVVYQNLIDTYFLNNDYEKCSNLLIEYSSKIDKTNKSDLLEYNNYLLQYHRQTNLNHNDLFNFLNSSYNEIQPLITEKEKKAANIHELKIYFNNFTIRVDLLHTIEKDLTYYQSLNLIEKLNAFEAIYYAITSPDRKQVLYPFDKMYETIFILLQKSFEEIDKYIETKIEDFQIYEKCSLLEKKVWLYNFQKCDSSGHFIIIMEKLRLIEYITDIYASNGNIIETIISKLNFIDECMDCMQNSINDGQKNILKDKMTNKFESVEIEVQQYLKHPAMPPLFIRMAKYSSFFDNIESTKKYYNLFEELNLSINHYAAWIQNYYNDVKNYLNIFKTKRI